MNLQRVKRTDSPRECLLKNFGEIITERLNIRNNENKYEMPIKGGWGYDKEDAVIIDRFDPVVDQNLPFDGVSIEYIFAHYRLYPELDQIRKDDEDISYEIELKKQELIQDETGIYDKLIFNCIVFIKDKNNLDDDTKIIHFEREYWFEISSFYGQNIGNNRPDENIIFRLLMKLPMKLRISLVYIITIIAGLGLLRLISRIF